MALLLERLMRTPILWYVCGLIASAVGATVSTVYQFPPSSWLENITIRSNGNILVVRFDQPEVHEIDILTSTPSARLVARFEGKHGIQGIVETEPDVFAIMPFEGSSYSLWTVDLGLDGKKKEIISRISDVGTLNGLTKLSTRFLLASDTKNGAIVCLDTTTGSSSTVIADETMVSVPYLGIGINGIRARSTAVYYTNFWKGILCKLPVDPLTATQTGPTQVVATDLGILDDLAIGVEDGQPSYIMQYLAGTIVRIQDDGRVEIVAEGLAYVTSAQFGRTERDQNVLYVSSSGNPLGPTAKGWIEGGKVYAVHLGS